MKSPCILALALALLIPAAAQAQSGTLVGTWEMVSRKQIYPDTTIDRGRFLGPSYKIINETHFAFGRQTIVGGEPQEDVFAGGGRYTLVGDSVYTEHIEYHSNQALIGSSITFGCRIEGDRWYHTGQLGNLRLEEVWQRIH